MSDYPGDLLYSKEHEWIRIQENIATIGITHFAAEQLGDVTMVELPNEGDVFEQEQIFGTVESVKSVSDLFTPVSGKVLKVNTPLADSPENVNDDPYDEGWMVEIEMTNTEQAKALMSADSYVAFLKEQDA